MLDPQNQISQRKNDKVIIIALFIGSNSIDNQYQLEELERLINTLGGQVIDRIVQYRKNIDSKFYFGKGKLKNIFEYALEKKCKYIVINNDISPSHIKNIQSYFQNKVFIKDRTGIILDIFDKHAKTKEAKTQIKLAQLEYLLPRLTRQWTHLERQMGGIGTRGGPGETQIEIDRRLVRNQIIKLKKELAKILNTQRTQKKNRKNIYKASLIGYTNAGKSTIMKRLSNKDMYIKDELFATLDTNTKRIKINKKNSFIISDTVGFIRSLPDNLIASFRSTLGELIDSDLLLKIVDISSPEYEMHLESIDTVLNHLKINDKRYLVIFNKIDQLENDALIKNLKKRYPYSLFISAFNNINIDSILDAVNIFMNKNNISKTIYVPYSKGKLIDDIYQNCQVLDREDNKLNIKFRISGPRKQINNIVSDIKK